MKSSRSGAYATKVSVAATRLTGASSQGNPRSATRAAISAPYPHDSESSYATSTLFVLRIERSTASQSKGESVRRSITSTLTPSCSSSCLAATRVRCTTAPYVTTVRCVPSHDLRLPERDHEVGAGIRGLVVGLAVEVLVLEEEDGVVAADGGAQQAVGVERRGRAHDPQPRHGGEDHGPRLRVVDRAALQVPAVRDAHDRGTRELVVGAPAQRGQLVADLVIRGPDIVEELGLDHGFQAPRGEADRPAHDVGFRQGRVVDALAPELTLQAPGDLEDPALALDLLEELLAAAVRHVLPESEDARIAGHLVLEAGVEQVHHRGGIAGEPGIVLGVELLRGGVDVGRIDVEQRGLGARLGRREGDVRGDLHFLVHLRADRLELGLRGDALAHEALGEGDHAVTLRLLLALPRRPVEDLVVGERVGIGSCDAGVHEGGPLALATMLGGTDHRLVRRDGSGAVHVFYR